MSIQESFFRTRTPPFFRVTAAVTLGLLILLGVVTLTACHKPRDSRSVLLRLGRERALLARISIDDVWSACKSTRERSTAFCQQGNIKRLVSPQDLAALDASVKGDGGHSRLLADLVLGQGKDLERIVSQLEAATSKYPADAGLLTDVAASQLALGWEQGLASSFVNALQAADRALKIEPSNARACFNRSFALEDLGLRDLAEQGWEHCAHLERDPAWRAEAARRARDLQAQLHKPARQANAADLERDLLRGGEPEIERWARERPQAAIGILVRELLPKWSDAGLLPQAIRSPRLEQMAVSVEQQTKDRLLLDIISQTRSGIASGHGREITKGLGRFRQGLAAYNERQYQRVASGLAKSALNLQSVPALRAVVRAYRAIALNSSDQVDAARKELLLLAPETETLGYHGPLGYTHLTLGRMALKRNRPLEARDHYLRALRAFEENRSEDLVPAARIQLAESYSSLGQSEQAWGLARQAAIEAYNFGAASRLFYVLNLFAGIADTQGKTDLALYAQTSTLYHAIAEVPRTRANAHIWRAYLLGRRAEYAAAEEDLRQAESLAPGVTDRSEHARLAEEIALARGVLAEPTDLEASAAWLEKTIQLSQRTGDRFVRLVALKARAEALRKMGRIEAAIADLKSAMATYDAAIPDLLRKQGGNPSERYRLTYLRQNADLYQAIIELYVEDLHAPWKALILADRAVALQAPGAVPSLSLAEARVERWRRALPKETGLLVYGSVGQRIVAWVLTPAGRRFFWLGRFDELTALLAKLDQATDGKAWDDLSREVHRRLISPLSGSLHQVRRLLIVPSPGIDRVPFAGLLDAESGKYLVETHLLEMLPCASSLLPEGGSPKRRSARRHGLVVGAPQPTRASLLGLPTLRFAEEEAHQVATSLGQGTVLLLGGDATPERFRKAAAAGASTIHVAGHALALGRDPDSAALILATSPEDEEGFLRPRDILDLPLSRTDLVVLSACSSAGGPVISWQSGLTLARAFLSAGAKRVVATLQTADDEESAQLFKDFYEELSRGVDAAASLWAAQKKSIQRRREAGRRRPPTWPSLIILESHPST
jgi:tetratricopeptide (TPR) repeat protein